MLRIWHPHSKWKPQEMFELLNEKVLTVYGFLLNRNVFKLHFIF